MYNNNIYGLSYNSPKLVEVLERFLEGNAKSAEFVYPTSDYSSCDSAANSLRAAAKRQHVGLKVSTKAGKVYMTKTI